MKLPLSIIALALATAACTHTPDGAAAGKTAVQTAPEVASHIIRCPASVDASLTNALRQASAGSDLGAILRDAADVGDTEVVRCLLDAGADPNAASPSGYTPLILAAERGHIHIVRLLLEKGADVNIVGRDTLWKTNHTALAAAARNGHTDIVRLLLDNGATQNVKVALIKAAIAGHTETVKLLIDNGALIGGKPFFAPFVLMEAAKGGTPTSSACSWKQALASTLPTNTATPR